MRAAYEGTSPPKQDAIKQASFTRFIMAMWCIPTTFLLCRLVFCIFGTIAPILVVSKGFRRSHYLPEHGGGKYSQESKTHLSRARTMSAHVRHCLSTQTAQNVQIHRSRNHFANVLSFGILQASSKAILGRQVSRVVSKHLTEIPCGQFTTLQALNILLSTINTEIESKISAQEGNFWKTLLGDDALLHSLGLGTRTSSIPSFWIERLFLRG